MSFLMLFLILGLITIFVLAIIAIVIYSSSPSIPKDRVKVWNFMRQYTEDNYSEGYLTKTHQGAERTLIEFIPTDIEDTEDSKKIRKQHIVVGNDKIIPMIKGTFNNNEAILILLPPRGDDLPKQLRETSFGKTLIKLIEDINLDMEEKKLLRSAMETQSELLMDTKGFGLVRKHLKEDKALFKDTKKKMLEDKEKKSPGFPLGQNRED